MNKVKFAALMACVSILSAIGGAYYMYSVMGKAQILMEKTAFNKTKELNDATLASGKPSDFVLNTIEFPRITATFGNLLVFGEDAKASLKYDAEKFGIKCYSQITNRDERIASAVDQASKYYSDLKDEKKLKEEYLLKIARMENDAAMQEMICAGKQAECLTEQSKTFRVLIDESMEKQKAYEQVKALMADQIQSDNEKAKLLNSMLEIANFVKSDSAIDYGITYEARRKIMSYISARN